MRQEQAAGKVNMEDRALVVVKNLKDGSERDLDIPLDISLHDFISALSSIYGMKLEEERMGRRHLSVENPVVLLKGNHLLRAYGLRDGSIIYLSE